MQIILNYWLFKINLYVNCVSKQHVLAIVCELFSESLKRVFSEMDEQTNLKETLLGKKVKINTFKYR
jgi:regulator of extracellular matrix RemA (YlzA/DUF370 family)